MASSITMMTPTDTSSMIARLWCPATWVSALSTVLPATWALMPGGAGTEATMSRTAATDSWLALVPWAPSRKICT